MISDRQWHISNYKKGLKNPESMNFWISLGYYDVFRLSYKKSKRNKLLSILTVLIISTFILISQF